MSFSPDFSRRYEKLPVTIFKEQPEASKLILDAIIAKCNEKAKEGKKCVLALAASSACIQIYDDMVKAYEAGKLSFKSIEIFSMDEYYPLDRNELQSHYRFFKEYIFDLVDIPQENIHCLQSNKMENVLEYCASFEKEIEKAGGIDILITSNMGMNEPGSPYNSKTRQITLNYTSRVAAASDFFGVEYVPHHALTMGIDTILKARKIFYLAWGEGKAASIKKLAEGEVTDQVPASYLQNHDNVDIYIDEAASVNLTRVETPWLTQKCEWSDYLTRKSVFWLCKKLNKPILKLTDRDYNDNGMSDLITEKGSASSINIKVFNDLQHTISGWPGGKPNADDSTRPERALPYPKRVIVFSPHPDDDVISMGGTVARLSQQGHELHMAYQVSGNIAVFDHDVVRYLDFIRESSDRLLNITGELLNLTQVESGKLTIKPKIVKPIELIEYAIKATQVLAERFHCFVEVEYPEKISKLFVDNEKIAWVITNLLSNAIHHSPENSRIIIGAIQHEKQVDIYVQDFGHGIDPRYHKSIFERYFRVPGTKVQGSGLGLAISKEFLEAHGGTISIESEIGKGCRFTVSLPV